MLSVVNEYNWVCQRNFLLFGRCLLTILGILLLVFFIVDENPESGAQLSFFIVRVQLSGSSAVIMSLVMFAAASWMTHKYELTILWGCLAVLWSGWTFAGVIFIPLAYPCYGILYQYYKYVKLLVCSLSLNCSLDIDFLKVFKKHFN